MPNPTQTAMNASRIVHKKLMGVSVVVSDGATSSSSITVTVGFSNEILYTPEGSTLYTRNRDYIIDVADYDVGAGAIIPTKHHTITEVINGVSKVFQVVEDSGDSESKYEDTKGRKFWRVHTKELS